MNDQAATNQESEAQFLIQRIYMKDLSFETNNTPAIFQQKWGIGCGRDAVTDQPSS